MVLKALASTRSLAFSKAWIQKRLEKNGSIAKLEDFGAYEFLSSYVFKLSYFQARMFQIMACRPAAAEILFPPAPPLSWAAEKPEAILAGFPAFSLEKPRAGSRRGRWASLQAEIGALSRRRLPKSAREAGRPLERALAARTENLSANPPAGD
jgi:hypothetical protein